MAKLNWLAAKYLNRTTLRLLYILLAIFAIAKAAGAPQNPWP